MKEIRRDFTVVIDVPDEVKPEDCDITVEASASYLGSHEPARASVLPEEPYEVEPELPKPKCPKCGEEIDSLTVSWRAGNIPGYATIVDGKLDTEAIDSVKVWELIVDDSAVYSCPECEETLFKADEEDKAEEFLKNIPSEA